MYGKRFISGFLASPSILDAIYTERYMGNASEHDYDLTNVARNVSNFHYVSTLLVHGTGDDNVHFQNALELISAFVRENVHFNLMVTTAYIIIF